MSQTRQPLGSKEASNPATNAERLCELSAHPHLRLLVAGNPAAPAPLLEDLAQDQNIQVRQAVANNPNTPWKTLERLAWEFPDTFLSNPVGSFQIMAHPDQISTNHEFWAHLLQTPEIPPLWWGWLRNQPALTVSPSVRLHVEYAGEAVHPFGVPEQEQAWDQLALVELLSAARAQGAALPVLAESNLAGGPMTSGGQSLIDRLQWLAHNEDRWIRAAVASNEHTPTEVLRSLAQDEHGEGVRSSVAGNPRTPVDVLLNLVQDEKQWVRHALAKNPQAPVEVLSSLAQDEAEWVRAAVASNPQTPGVVFQRLAQDRDSEVCWWASLIQGLLVEGPFQGQKWWKEIGSVELNPFEEDDPFREDDPAVQRLLDQVIKLDASEYVRQTIIAALATAWDTRKIQVAFRVSEIIFGTHHDLGVGRKHSRRIMIPFMPPIALQKLAASPSWEVRYLVALHEKTPWETRQRLGQDGNRYVRAMARAMTEMRHEPVQ